MGFNPALVVAAQDSAAADLARGKSSARLVVPVDIGDGLVSPEGSITPPASTVRRSRREADDYKPGYPEPRSERLENGPTIRTRFTWGDAEFSVTVRVDKYDRPAGKVTLRSGGRIIMETNKDFGDVADVILYCQKFVDSVLPGPIYPKRDGRIAGDPNADPISDAEMQVARLQSEDPEALSYPAKHTGAPEVLVRL